MPSCSRCPRDLLNAHWPLAQAYRSHWLVMLLRNGSWDVEVSEPSSIQLGDGRMSPGGPVLVWHYRSFARLSSFAKASAFGALPNSSCRSSISSRLPPFTRTVSRYRLPIGSSWNREENISIANTRELEARLLACIHTGHRTLDLARLTTDSRRSSHLSLQPGGETVLVRVPSADLPACLDRRCFSARH